LENGNKKCANEELNLANEAVVFTEIDLAVFLDLPIAPPRLRWHLAVDTSHEAPQDLLQAMNRFGDQQPKLNVDYPDFVVPLARSVERGEVDRGVAIFFLSRIDALVEPLVEDFIEAGGRYRETAKKAHRQVAISGAKAAYQIYKEIFGSNRFKKLADKGTRAQRLLWASTSTKNPDYTDVKYVEALIGLDTVNTVPPETIDAYRDHGDPKSRLEQDVKEAYWIMGQLPELGISIDKVTQQLEDEGVQKFNTPFDTLMETLINKSIQSN